MKSAILDENAVQFGSLNQTIGLSKRTSFSVSIYLGVELNCRRWRPYQRVLAEMLLISFYLHIDGLSAAELQAFRIAQCR